MYVVLTVLYIGMYLSDLTFIDEGNPSFTEDGSINYTKWKQSARVIQRIRKYQAVQFPFRSVDLLQEYEMTSPWLFSYFSKLTDSIDQDEKALYQISLECQPRGAHSMIKRMPTLNNLANNVKDLVGSKARRFQQEVGFTVDVNCIH